MLSDLSNAVTAALHTLLRITRSIDDPILDAQGDPVPAAIIAQARLASLAVLRLCKDMLPEPLTAESLRSSVQQPTSPSVSNPTNDHPDRAATPPAPIPSTPDPKRGIESLTSINTPFPAGALPDIPAESPYRLPPNGPGNPRLHDLLLRAGRRAAPPSRRRDAA